MGSIMVRAEVTADELRELRKLALDMNVSAPTLIGEALREKLELAGRQPKRERGRK